MSVCMCSYLYIYTYTCIFAEIEVLMKGMKRHVIKKRRKKIQILQDSVHL